MGRAPVRPALAKRAAASKQRRALAQLQEFQSRPGAETGRGVFGETEAHRRRRVMCGEVPIGPRFQAVVPKFGSEGPSRERGDELLYRPPARAWGDADSVATRDCDCLCVVR